MIMQFGTTIQQIKIKYNKLTTIQQTIPSLLHKKYNENLTKLSIVVLNGSMVAQNHEKKIA